MTETHKYRKNPVVVEAHQWFRNGDHPLDHDTIGLAAPASMDLEKYDEYLRMAGKVVRRYRTPELTAEDSCKHCGEPMGIHGWVDTKEGGHIVCPGDWIITGIQGEFYPCKPDIFKATYEKVDS